LTIAAQLRGIEGVDVAVAEVSNEQVITEEPEVGRRERQPPRRVEPPLRGDPAEQVASRIESVHEAMALAGHIVLLVRVLQRVSHVDDTAQVPDPKWRVARGKSGISERTGDVDRIEMAVEHIDGARVEVGRVEEVARRGTVDSEP